MTQLRTNRCGEAEARLKRGEASTNLITQDKNQPVSMEDQIMQLYALRRGVLDELSSVQIKQFKKEFGASVRQSHPSLTADLRKEKTLSPEMKRTLDELLKRYLQQLMTQGQRVL